MWEFKLQEIPDKSLVKSWEKKWVKEWKKKE